MKIDTRKTFVAPSDVMPIAKTANNAIASYTSSHSQLLKLDDEFPARLPPQRKFVQGANNSLDDLKHELQLIIEKEKALTDEIIKNSLVKNNGKFNYEALANLNEIIQSKKDLKKKFAAANQAPSKDD
jgi:hypothetical protein